MNHGVGIPFGVTPDINYNYNLTINRNSSFTVQGERDQASNHEFYVYQVNTDMRATLFQAKNKGFEYLVPVMRNASFKIQF